MEFNVLETTERIIDDIKSYYKENNAKGAVIGISGGKDSAVVASLLTKALGRDNVIGLWLPCHSKESDRLDAIEVANSLGIRLVTHDLTNTYDMIVRDIKDRQNIVGDNLINNSNINLKPRLRMNILYYYAAYFTELFHGTFLVCGTSNKSEMFVGYFTKGGDNVCDISPIKQLYVDEVIKIGDYLKMVPEHIIHKTPDDGLSDKTDEEKMGVTYDEIKRVSLEQEIGARDEFIPDEVREKILKMHRNNAHKFNVPTFRR